MSWNRKLKMQTRDGGARARSLAHARHGEWGLVFSEANLCVKAALVCVITRSAMRVRVQDGADPTPDTASRGIVVTWPAGVGREPGSLACVSLSHLVTLHVLACLIMCVRCICLITTVTLKPTEQIWLLLVSSTPQRLLGVPAIRFSPENHVNGQVPHRRRRRRRVRPCRAPAWRAGSRGDDGRAWSGGRSAWSACRTRGTGSASLLCACECGGRARRSGRTSYRSQARCTGRVSLLQNRDILSPPQPSTHSKNKMMIYKF